jgi:plasmid stabilization system protein ParE
VKPVLLTREAQLELRAAAHWYSEQENGLGEDFVAEVDRTLELVAEGAQRYPVWRPDRPYRRALVRRFPYVLFFTNEADSVRVLAVAHQKRKPGYWLRRVR